MYEHIDSWKNSESAFTHQLNRNKEELDNNYPPHHNRDNFVALCEKYSYNIHPLDDNIYLVKNDKPI